MICFPNAKINIGLNILRKREDGYHDIESVMYPLKGILYDALEIVRSSEFGVRSSGIKIPGDEKENICVKAYHLIAKNYPLPPIKIYLHKTIPMGAGLGGGSADAAFFIRLLNDLFELGISWGEMHNYARQLGSDCSFFISNMPSFAEGRGEKLETIKEIESLKGKYIAVIYPDVHVSTAEAYSQWSVVSGQWKKQMQTDKNRFKQIIHPSESELIRWNPFSKQLTTGKGRSLENDVLNLPISEWKKYIHNDFEDSIFPKYPELKKIKEKLYSLSALYASMSGSGSALYGIFKKATKIKELFQKYHVWEGKLSN